MSQSLFADKIIDKLSSAIGTDGQNFGNDTATKAAQAIADGITEYLLDNTQVIVAYVGIIPGTPPVPDPIVTDTFKIVGQCPPAAQSGSFDAWVKQIETNIIAGFMLDAQGQAGVMFPTKPFALPGIILTQAMLTSAHDVSDENPQKKVWEIICGAILTWLNSTAMNVVPGAGTRPTGPSTGTATITKIIVS